MNKPLMWHAHIWIYDHVTHYSGNLDVPWYETLRQIWQIFSYSRKAY